MVDLLPVTVSVPEPVPAGGPGSVASLEVGRTAWMTALAGAEVPYREVARALAGDSDSDDPVTNLAIEELNVSFAERTVTGLRIRPQPRQYVRVRHDLTLSVPRGDGAPPHLLIPTARWDPGAVHEIAAALARRITALVAESSPDWPDPST